MWRMCEFHVIVDGEVVFSDVVYAGVEGDRVIVRDILGASREFKNYKIVEVNVNTTRLVLSPH
jgi:predicted RNA-binding protein